VSSSGGIGSAGPLGRDPFASLESLRSGKIVGKEGQLRAAADLMEGAFFQELFKALRATVPESGLLGGGGGEEVFSSLMDQHLAEVAAGRLERGLGEALYRRLAGPGEVDSQETPGSADAMRMENSAPTSTGRSG